MLGSFKPINKKIWLYGLFLTTLFLFSMFAQKASAGVVETVLIDNGTPGYVESSVGAWADSGYLGYNGSTTRYTSEFWNMGAYVKWTPTLTVSGDYIVSIYSIRDVGTDPNAKAEIVHAGGTDTQYLNWTAGSNGWQVLGTYHFDSGSAGFVKLSRGTTNTKLRGDAVKFERLSDDTSLTPSADVYVRGGTDVNNNFATASELQVKKDTAEFTRESYLKFNLESVSNQPIGSAKLYFYAAVTDPAGTDIDLKLYGSLDESWQENTVTWNTYRPTPYDYLQTASIHSASQEYQWYSLDVTSYVRAQIASGHSANFVLLEDVAKGLLVRIKSKESPANKPYLLIDKKVPDLAAPTWPTSSILTTDSSGDETAVTLSWTAAQDSTSITGYNIYQEGKLIGTVDGQTFTYPVTGLTMNTKYTFKVEAVNAASKISVDGPYRTTRTGAVRLEQQKLGNVFLDNENARFKFVTDRQTLVWQVSDLNGKLVKEGTMSNSGTEAMLSFPMSHKGYFVLRTTLESPGRTPVELKTTFAVLAPYDWLQVQDSPFGVNTHLSSVLVGWSPLLADLAREAGAKSVRDGFYWGTVESVPGQYQFNQDYRDKMIRLGQNQVQMIGALGLNNPLYDQNSTPYTDEGRTAFANYALKTIEEYGSQTPWVEVWNEYNLAGYGDRGNGPADSKPEYYYLMLKKTYETIKPVYPNVTIVGPAAANVPLDWFEEFFKLGGLQYLDAISIHPYTQPSPPEVMVQQLEGLKTLIRKYNNGQLIPIYSTEFGWSTQEGGNTEKQEADYLVRGYVLQLASGIEKIYMYDLMNDGIETANNEHNFGMIRNLKDPLGAYTPKPAYAAYAAMTRQLTGWQFDSKDSTGSNLYSYLFKQDQSKTRVVWATRDTLAAIAADGPLQVTDMMGNTETFVPYQGYVYVTITDEPLYIKGNVSGISEAPDFQITGEDGILGDPVSMMLHVQYGGSSAISATFSMEGISASVQASPGQNVSVPLTIPGSNQIGDRKVTGYLEAGGVKFGKIKGHVQTVYASQAAFYPYVDPESGQKSLRFELTNRSITHAAEFNRIDWQFGGQSGIAELNLSLAPGTSQTYSIQLSEGTQLGVSYAANVKVTMAGREPYKYQGKLDFNVIPAAVSIVDGVIDAPAASPTADLANGVVQMTGYTGVNDLSGKVWLNYDQDNLYISAQVTDNVFAYPASDQNIWQNDNIQFAIAPGLPGSSTQWFEYGISQTGSGPQIYRWIAPNGFLTGDRTGSGELTITRDEIGKRTVYELALPWSEISPVKEPGSNGMSLSLLVNDNDGSGRKGYIEWGSGIGSSKDPSKFRSVQWGLASEASVTLATYGASASVMQGDTLDLSVGITKADAISQAALTINYDASRYTYVSLEPASNGVTATQTTSQDGQITIHTSLNNSELMNEDMSLFKLRFTVRNDAPVGSTDFTVIHATAEYPSGLKQVMSTVTTSVYVENSNESQFAGLSVGKQQLHGLASKEMANGTSIHLKAVSLWTAILRRK
ncbi:DUF7594 domain-containing protein [Paenibacillus qinlingensis]|uniref:CBM96 family carbohydrate-binding protein n=1 Tax=Paenibacillus qinlingensis TaxID=1837343 RepID=UPI001564265F|nr:DNRLRE domain-containing protein [Paenibacillus qinlingensis]NQX60539.1 DNRLRE domain-containing protein [Paenibacillus qinlingensis]